LQIIGLGQFALYRRPEAQSNRRHADHWPAFDLCRQPPAGTGLPSASQLLKGKWRSVLLSAANNSGNPMLNREIQDMRGFEDEVSARDPKPGAKPSPS